MNAHSPYILFLPQARASFQELLTLADALHAAGKFRPVFIIHWAGSDDAVQACIERGYAFRLYRQAIQPSPKGKAQKTDTATGGQKKPRQLIQRLKNNFVAKLVYYLLRYGRDRRFAEKQLAELQPACLVLVGDRHIGIETALVRVANLRGIPSLIVPFAISAAEGGVNYRLGQERWETVYGMANPINRLTARLRPSWTYHSRHGRLLWLPPATLFAAELRGMAPPHPWAIAGGGTWLIGAENQAAREQLIQDGVWPEKIQVVGKPRHDQAARLWQNAPQAKRRICAELGLAPEKPLLVCAVPQMAEHEFLSWEEHWREIEFLFKSFARLQPNVNTVLSLHPKSDFAQYAPRAEKYGLTIAQTHSYDQLIPICDVYVATFSSTVTLAIACHKPTVVIDFYGFNYDIFDDVAGIQVVREHEAFLPLLQRLFSDEAFYQQMVTGQAEAAPYWARFDGKATERILNLIDELVEKGRAIQKLPPRQRRAALPPWSR